MDNAESKNGVFITYAESNLRPSDAVFLNRFLEKTWEFGKRAELWDTIRNPSGETVFEIYKVSSAPATPLESPD